MPDATPRRRHLQDQVALYGPGIADYPDEQFAASTSNECTAAGGRGNADVTLNGRTETYTTQRCHDACQSQATEAEQDGCCSLNAAGTCTWYPNGTVSVGTGAVDEYAMDVPQGSGLLVIFLRLNFSSQEEKDAMIADFEASQRRNEIYDIVKALFGPPFEGAKSTFLGLDGTVELENRFDPQEPPTIVIFTIDIDTTSSTITEINDNIVQVLNESTNGDSIVTEWEVVDGVVLVTVEIDCTTAADTEDCKNESTEDHSNTVSVRISDDQNGALVTSSDAFTSSDGEVRTIKEANSTYELLFALLLALSICLLCVILFFCCYEYKKYKEEEEDEFVKVEKGDKFMLAAAHKAGFGEKSGVFDGYESQSSISTQATNIEYIVDQFVEGDAMTGFTTGAEYEADGEMETTKHPDGYGTDESAIEEYNRFIAVNGDVEQGDTLMEADGQPQTGDLEMKPADSPTASGSSSSSASGSSSSSTESATDSTNETDRTNETDIEGDGATGDVTGAPKKKKKRPQRLHPQETSTPGEGNETGGERRVLSAPGTMNDTFSCNTDQTKWTFNGDHSTPQTHSTPQGVTKGAPDTPTASCTASESRTANEEFSISSAHANDNNPAAMSFQHALGEGFLDPMANQPDATGITVADTPTASETRSKSGFRFSVSTHTEGSSKRGKPSRDFPSQASMATASESETADEDEFNRGPSTSATNRLSVAGYNTEPVSQKRRLDQSKRDPSMRSGFFEDDNNEPNNTGDYSSVYDNYRKATM
eukprot:UN24549